MTPEEIEAKRVAEEQVDAQAETDALTTLQAENARLIEERDNYKNVALKRLGKLPGDAAFLDKDGDGEMSVAEQVRIEILNREIDKNKVAEAAEIERIKKENSELKLAIKNRPGSSIGGSSGAVSEIKDNVFSVDQLLDLKKRAERLKVDPEKFIANAKINFQKRA